MEIPKQNLEEELKDLINLAKKGLKFQDFVKHYGDLYVLETLWEDLQDDTQNILNSEEYEEEYGD